jgi:hypothetical protein
MMNTKASDGVALRGLSATAVNNAWNPVQALDIMTTQPGSLQVSKDTVSRMRVVGFSNTPNLQAQDSMTAMKASEEVLSIP